MSGHGTPGRAPGTGSSGAVTIPCGTEPAESWSSGRAENGSVPSKARAAASEVTEPSTRRVHGSTRSFAGFVRTPRPGSHGPWTRRP